MKDKTENKNAALQIPLKEGKINTTDDLNIEKCRSNIDLCSDAMDIDIRKGINAMGFEKETNVDNDEEKNVINCNIQGVNDPVLEETEDIQLVYKEESNTESFVDTVKKTPPKPIVPNVINAKTPRRVQLITLSSPKGGKKIEPQI